MPFKSLFTAVALLSMSGAAAAHPKLLSSNPSANAVVATPTRIELHFSEKLVPAFSKGNVTMAAMPGMAAMKLLSTASVAKDGKTLVLSPKTRLTAGRYVVEWHAVSTDTHKVDGNYAFTVK